MVKRLVTKAGDIYQTIETARGSRYFQLVAIDHMNLESDVIVIFRNPAAPPEPQATDRIASLPIESYTHTIVAQGLRDGLWHKVGKADVQVDLRQLLFKNYQELELGEIEEQAIARGLVPRPPLSHPRWVTWAPLDEAWKYHKEDAGKRLAAMSGGVYPPSHVIRLIENRISTSEHGWPKGSIEKPSTSGRGSLFRRLFSKKKPAIGPDTESAPQQAVIAAFDFPDNLSDREILGQVYDLEDKLDEALQAAGAGDCDGHDLGEGEVTVYLYGPDADQLFKIAEPILKEAPSKPVRITLRYGKADSRGNRYPP